MARIDNRMVPFIEFKSLIFSSRGHPKQDLFTPSVSFNVHTNGVLMYYHMYYQEKKTSRFTTVNFKSF